MEDDYPAIVTDWASGGSLYNFINMSIDYDKIQIVRITKNFPGLHLSYLLVN